MTDHTAAPAQLLDAARTGMLAAYWARQPPDVPAIISEPGGRAFRELPGPMTAPPLGSLPGDASTPIDAYGRTRSRPAVQPGDSAGGHATLKPGHRRRGR